MKLRIKDIAEAAGVSPATVSNVLNHKKGVSAVVAQNVMRIAQGMGYSAGNVIAPLPAERKSIRFVMFKKHGLVIMDTPFFAELIDGVEQTCREYGYELLISNVNQTDANCEEVIRRICEDANTPFILLGTEMSDEDLAPFANSKATMVVLDRDCSYRQTYSVTMDNFGAGYTAGSVLLSCGHTHIGYLASSRPFRNCTQRRYGLECALNEQHLQIAEDDYVLLEPTMEGAYRDMRTHLDSRHAPLPTAFFAMNDIIAIGASRALKECGYALPRDVSIIGMDDIPAASIVSPALTTIGVSKADYGRAAVAQLVYALRQNRHGTSAVPPTTLVTHVTLVERTSVATPTKARDNPVGMETHS